jgi:hypothetical protein
MGFEQFPNTGTSTRGVDYPSLAIYRTGTGRFNQEAVRKWFDGVDTVGIYIDREATQLGVERNPGAHGYSVANISEGATLSMQGVCSSLGVDVHRLDEPVYLELENDPDEGLLVADLDPLLEVAGDE